MEAQVIEAQPFKTLKELYDKVNNLQLWPHIKELRESTDYVYCGSDINISNIYLKKVDRENQPKTLLCHDMKGGYLEDRFIGGSKSHDAYLFYHWSVIDTFVYFSHYFITIPPFGWINAAHDHGVKVLGTVITEREGIWEPILESQETARRFADALILVAKFYKFEGWLLNVENQIHNNLVNNLIYFMKYLTECIHTQIRDSEVIWYDSITNNGELNWQNEINDKNVEFFLNCDGIYLNYNWTQSKLLNSYTLARSHNRNVQDIYVGLDVWGRGCPGGGGFNSSYALEKIRQQGLSVAIFASGWTHEFFGPKTFHELETLFWAQLFPYLYVHVPIYENEVFKTSFCHGNGSSHYRYGEVQFEMRVVEGKNIFERKSFYNLAMQKPQISVPIPHLKFMHVLRNSENEGDKSQCSKMPIECIYETKKHAIRILKNIVNIEDKSSISDINYFEFCDQFSYEGGGCLKLITNDPKLYHRLFLIHIEFQQDIHATVVYEETGSLEGNAIRNEPILILANDTGLKSIMSYRSENVNPRWKKCFYLTNMKTVKEIGVSFARKSVCYLGEIVLERKERHHFGVVLVVFGILVLVHGASLGGSGAGLWAGAGALVAGALGVVATLATSSSKTNSSFSTAHLAASLIALALSNMAAITALTAIVRDSQRTPEITLFTISDEDNNIDGVEGDWAGLLPSIGLLVTSVAELLISGYSCLTLTPKLCGCLRVSNSDEVGNDGRMKTRNMVHQWVTAQNHAPKSQPIYVVQPMLPIHPLIQVPQLMKVFLRSAQILKSLTYKLFCVDHGCFGEYLQRMGRESTAQCHHCGEEVDTARHTLEECPA
ncbi:uncharacterized protein LOC128888008 isoform X2 [Hylaeus anthracinus]|uniref:uncharacterized protein LOC128888008 isoform X2 n=1 Tax=Hylaeus anthracinus TaxID=313031 RepID=UPI0023B88F10|nr:uncharacterized protein LOC128888008 isoform X2 [Hylaeus anthracinus]